MPLGQPSARASVRLQPLRTKASAPNVAAKATILSRRERPVFTLAPPVFRPLGSHRGHGGFPSNTTQRRPRPLAELEPPAVCVSPPLGILGGDVRTRSSAV